MSFSVDLWNGYDLVFNTFNLHRRGLKDFIYMLTEKFNYELEQAKGLKKIYELNYLVTKMSSLQNGIIAFRNDISCQSKYALEFLNCLKEDLIDPLKIFMNEQNSEGKKLNQEIKKQEKDFKDAVEKMEKMKIKFHLSAKNAEEIKFQSELGKVNCSLNPELRNKMENRFQNSLKEAKDSERNYISSINSANSLRENFIENMKKTMNNFQKLEENLGEVVKDSLRKYIVYQVAYIRNMQYDIERKANIMESINIQHDIKEFVENNSTNDVPPYKYEFIPYISEIDSKSNDNLITNGQNLHNNIPKNTLDNVKNFISNVFFNSIPENNQVDSNDSKNFDDIQNIIEYACNKDELDQEIKKTFAKYSKEKKHRRYFLNNLNKMRLNANFTLNQKSYFNIGFLLYTCLDDSVKEKDYESIRVIIIIGQTLYKNANEPNKPRVFLQNLLSSNYIWKEEKFWEDIIRYVIIEELHNQKNYNLYSFESSEEKKIRVKNSIVYQLISYSYNMIAFNLEKNKTKSVIDYFKNYYDLDEKSCEELDTNFQDYSKMYETQGNNLKSIGNEEDNSNKKNEDVEINSNKSVLDIENINSNNFTALNNSKLISNSESIFKKDGGSLNETFDEEKKNKNLIYISNANNKKNLIVEVSSNEDNKIINAEKDKDKDKDEEIDSKEKIKENENEKENNLVNDKEINKDDLLKNDKTEELIENNNHNDLIKE